MSWSFSAVGKSAAVAARARDAKTSGVCKEPEETVRLATLEHIAVMAEGLVGSACQVSASGSMWSSGGEVKSCMHQLTFMPLYGFLE